MQSSKITISKVVINEQKINQTVDGFSKSEAKETGYKKEALHTFVMAGILDREGRFTENYPHLAAVTPHNRFLFEPSKGRHAGPPLLMKFWIG